MRMRRKKNLDSRICDCGNYFINLKRKSDRDARIEVKGELISFQSLFNNNNPVFLEIGCGKGQFAIEMAKAHQDLNFFAIEKSENVLVVAAESAKKQGVENVRFAACGAEYLKRYIPQNSISGIYLNFSCPYPKNSYENHRLTAKRFLDMYKIFLKSDAGIYQKTDNMKFFEYSVESFSKNGYIINKLLLDLHHSDLEGNIMTEYETKFSQQGLPIYFLEAFLKKEEI